MRTMARMISLIAALGLATAATAQTRPLPTSTATTTTGGMAKVTLPVFKNEPAEGSIPMNQFRLIDDDVCGTDEMKLVISHGSEARVVKHTVVCVVIDPSSRSETSAKANFPVVSGRPQDYSVPNGTVLLITGGCGNGFTIIGGGHKTNGIHRAVSCAKRG